MGNFFTKFKSEMFFRSIVMIIAGIILLLFPATTQNTIAYVISVVLVINGIIKIIGYFRGSGENSEGLNEYSSGLVVGILYIVFAALVSKILISIIPIILGIFVLASGLIKLDQGIQLIRANRGNAVGVMVMAGITIVAGILAIFNPFSTGNILLRVIGAGLLFGGITDLISTGYVSSKFKHLEDDDLSQY